MSTAQAHSDIQLIEFDLHGGVRKKRAFFPTNQLSVVD